MKDPNRQPRSPSGPSQAPPPAASAGDGPNFETAMKRLAEIVEQLESGELPLDESLRLFEEGVSLSRRAGELLDHAERKVEALTRAADGTLAMVPFDVQADEQD